MSFKVGDIVKLSQYKNGQLAARKFMVEKIAVRQFNGGKKGTYYWCKKLFPPTISSSTHTTYHEKELAMVERSSATTMKFKVGDRVRLKQAAFTRSGSYLRSLHPHDFKKEARGIVTEIVHDGKIIRVGFQITGRDVQYSWYPYDLQPDFRPRTKMEPQYV